MAKDSKFYYSRSKVWRENYLNSLKKQNEGNSSCGTNFGKSGYEDPKPRSPFQH